MLLFLDQDRNLIRKLGVDDIKVRYFDWVGDDRLLLVSSQTQNLWGFTTDKLEMSVGQIIPVTYAGEIEAVFGNTRKLTSSIFGDYGVRNIGGQWYGFFGALELRRDIQGSWVFDHGRPYLYQVDLSRNSTRGVGKAAAPGIDREWVVAANGTIAATFDMDTADGDWELSGPDGGVIASGNHPTGRAGVNGLGYDGSTVIYYERDEEGIAHSFEVPLAGGKPVPFLPDAEIERIYRDDATGHIIGYLDENEGPVFANPAHSTAVSKIRKAFRKYDMRMVDWTPNFEKVLVRTSGNGDSGSWYVVDMATMRANGFAWERLAIGPEVVGPISTFEYTAADGLEMDGILTLPPGREASNLPVVMLPHGGPHSRDREQFDWWAQAFASRGYAVFQPNFRGSTNRDQAFKLAGYGEWGRKMQTDISDGLKALADKGIVDPDRACIVGASYGGYAALAGVTVQQDIYRCAVSVNGVSDMRSMYNEDYRASGRMRLLKSAFLEQLGPKDRWDDVSPRRLAERADAPVLLIHGKDDTVVPYSHSSEMADRLKDHDKPHTLVTLEGEDHWLSLSKTRQQMLEEAVGFVGRHNPAD